jgi:hypothetical protein
MAFQELHSAIVVRVQRCPRHDDHHNLEVVALLLEVVLEAAGDIEQA